MDDRFDYWPTDSPPAPENTSASDQPFVAALASDRSGQPVGFLGGAPDRGGLRLDVLVVPAVTQPAELVQAMLVHLEPAIDALAPGNQPFDAIELWGRPAPDWLPAAAEQWGFQPHRQLFQMIGPLPAQATAIPTRPLDPDRSTDITQLVEVNNRAFAHHPDQGTLTVSGFTETMGEPWFTAEGVRLHERDGRLAGFCWTKVHRYDQHPATPDMGEIYVIGVDPDYHGQGLGVPMTAAGLQWLSDQGLTVGMLYVEADNEPAIRTYRRLGFSVARADMAWLKSR